MDLEPQSTAELIDMLGGTGAVARELAVTSGAVSHWRKSGQVAPTQHAKLLALCVQRQIYWRPPGWPACVELRHVRRRK